MASAITNLDELINRQYQYGFVTDIEADSRARAA